MLNIVIKINDKEFKQILNVDLKLSKVRIFILKNPEIQSYIDYSENILIFQHNGNDIDVNRENQALSKILVSNELFIKTFKNSEPTDVSFQIEGVGHFEELPLNMKLDIVRLFILNKRLGYDNYSFIHPICGEIGVDNEYKYTLEKIIEKNDKNINLINLSKKNRPNLSKLIESCESGFNMTKDEGTKKAPRKAITIIDPKFEEYDNPKIRGFVKKCNDVQENLYERNIALVGNLLLPWLSSCIGLKSSIEFEKKLDMATSYSIEKSEYASIEFTKSNYCLKPEFEDDVKSAVDSKLSLKEKLEKLEKIIENYGQFISKKIIFGGKIVKQLTSEANQVGESSSNTKNIELNISHPRTVGAGASASKTKSVNDITRSSETISYQCTIGGNGNGALLDDWYESLRDPDKWDIIEYKDVIPIFEILPDDLKNQVLKIIGQKILDVKTCRIVYDAEKNKNKAYVHRLVHNIQDIDKCQIFSTIKSKNKHNLKISYIIVGYGFRSKPGLDIRFIGEEKQIKHYNNRFIAEIERPTNEGSIIGSCVIKSYQNPVDPEDSKIISLHFHPSDKKVCIHSYDLNTKEIIEPSLDDCYIHYSTFEFSGSDEPYGKTKLTFNNDKKFFKNDKNSLWIKYDNCTQNQSIFMNLLFDCNDQPVVKPVKPVKPVVNVVFKPNVIFSALCEKTCISNNDVLSFLKLLIDNEKQSTGAPK
ncbi:13184_t:CDS:2 [Entrophospora sp. SA101]|nr:13184_t:CDS:2 [Entrophospora sp. SA101]